MVAGVHWHLMRTYSMQGTALGTKDDVWAQGHPMRKCYGISERADLTWSGALEEGTTEKSASGLCLER